MVLTLDDFINLMNNIKTDTLLSENTKISLAGYHYFIDYNYVLNLIPKPKVNLIIEYGYIDNYEKKLMATSNLDYIVETHHEIILTIGNNSLYDSLNDINGLVKDIYIFTRELLYMNGVSQYGKNDMLTFNIIPNPIDSIALNVANEYNLYDYYDVSPQSFNNVQSYRLLISPIPLGVFYKTFSLNPNSIQPSGCVNMNTITGQNIAVIVNDNNSIYYNSKINPANQGLQLKIIYTKYNILRIKVGSANLLFYS
jgi:hypothetical protein